MMVVSLWNRAKESKETSPSNTPGGGRLICLATHCGFFRRDCIAIDKQPLRPGTRLGQLQDRDLGKGSTAISTSKLGDRKHDSVRASTCAGDLTELSLLYQYSFPAILLGSSIHHWCLMFEVSYLFPIALEETLELISRSKEMELTFKLQTYFFPKF